MTHEECLQELVRLDNEYKKACNNLKDELYKNRSRVCNQWASCNARFNIGDIIESQETIIRIEKRIGRYSAYYRNHPLYVEYRGHQLTKKLQPRKDENRMSIYDDGREIKLLKSADNEQT